MENKEKFSQRAPNIKSDLQQEKKDSKWLIYDEWRDEFNKRFIQKLCPLLTI